jgi:hypothetical protein
MVMAWLIWDGIVTAWLDWDVDEVDVMVKDDGVVRPEAAVR